MYIDNGIVVSKSESQCCVHRDMVVSDLERAGFVLNLKKCCLEPCQTGKWLGFTVNLSEGKFLVPVCKLKASVRSILQFSRVPVRSLASAVGQIISMSLAMGPITRLRTRALYAVLNSGSSWTDKCYLPAEAHEELEFGKPMSSSLMEDQFGSTLVPQELYTLMPAVLGMVVMW